MSHSPPPIRPAICATVCSRQYLDALGRSSAGIAGHPTPSPCLIVPMLACGQLSYQM